MTRIATGASYHSALNDIMRAQRELNAATRQFSSGKTAGDLKEFGGGAQMLAATRNVLARETSYVEAGKRIQAKLDVQAMAVGQMSDAASELREAITEAIGLDDGSTLMARLEDLAARAADALNMKFGDAYLFGGGRDDLPPFAGNSLSQILAAPDVDSLFRNGDVRSVARLTDGTAAETGVLADEVGRELMATLKRIADFAEANGGGFSDPLSDAERVFLTDEIGAAKAAFDTINLVEARNGVMQNRIESATTRADERANALHGLVSDIEDADMAQVAVRLEQARLALDASARSFTMMAGSSLLDFLR